MAHRNVYLYWERRDLVPGKSLHNYSMNHLVVLGKYQNGKKLVLDNELYLSNCKRI